MEIRQLVQLESKIKIGSKVKSYNQNSSTNLVGVKTNAYSLCGLSSNVWITGIANAPVLPDPVSARPMISFPEKKFITATWYQHLFTRTKNYNTMIVWSMAINCTKHNIPDLQTSITKLLVRNNS